MIIGFSVILFIVLCVRLIVYFIKKNRFPKKNLIVFLAGIVIVLGINIYDEYFFTFDNLKGTLQEGPVISPNEKYTANAFYKPWGGAVGDVDIWVNVTNNTEKKATKTVYYSPAYEHFSIKWKNNNVLIVTNEGPDYHKSDSSIALDVRNEIYDQNGLACKSLLMKNDYKKCFKN